MRVKVVTDTTAVVPSKYGAELSITSVPVWLNFEDRSYRDAVDVEVVELYERLERGERVTTASPSPGDFVRSFQSAADEGYEAVFVTTVSGELSAIFDAARAAASVFSALPIKVFDSGSAVTGAGLVAIEAARAAAAGADIEGVTAAAGAVAEGVEVVGMVDTLRYLHRSGRVNTAKYWMGEALQVKPMFRLSGGAVSRAGLTRTVSGALDRILQLVAGESGSIHAGVFHAAAAERAAELKHRLEVAFPEMAEIFVSSFSSAMGAHTGPGVVGVGWWRS